MARKNMTKYKETKKTDEKNGSEKLWRSNSRQTNARTEKDRLRRKGRERAREYIEQSDAAFLKHSKSMSVVGVKKYSFTLSHPLKRERVGGRENFQFAKKN